MRPGQHGVGRFAPSMETQGPRTLGTPHPAGDGCVTPPRSSKPGGWEPVAACHAAAAPRWATRRDTAAPTPNEIDQMSASRQCTPRDAGFSGGSWWRLMRQRAVIPRRQAAAAAAPDANANTSHRRRCTPKSFPSSMSSNPCNARGGSESDVGDRRRLRPQGQAQMERSITILTRVRRSGVRNGRLISVSQPTSFLTAHAQRGMPE